MSKILIVDDEVVSTIILGNLLTGSGHDVRTAASGGEALEIGIDYKPDLLISDWKLKDELDGCQLARRLQAIDANLKVILFSGSSSTELAQEAKDIRVYAFMEKPCDIDEMLRKVEHALGK